MPRNPCKRITFPVKILNIFLTGFRWSSVYSAPTYCQDQCVGFSHEVHDSRHHLSRTHLKHLRTLFSYSRRQRNRCYTVHKNRANRVSVDLDLLLQYLLCRSSLLLVCKELTWSLFSVIFQNSIRNNWSLLELNARTWMFPIT